MTSASVLGRVVDGSWPPFCRWSMSDGFEEPPVVEPVDVLEGGVAADLVFLDNDDYPKVVVWRVGSDIQPGVYTVEYGCYCTIQRYSGYQYTADQLIWSTSLGTQDGRYVLEIQPSDVLVRFSNCD